MCPRFPLSILPSHHGVLAGYAHLTAKKVSVPLGLMMMCKWKEWSTYSCNTTHTHKKRMFINSRSYNILFANNNKMLPVANTMNLTVTFLSRNRPHELQSYISVKNVNLINLTVTMSKHYVTSESHLCLKYIPRFCEWWRRMHHYIMRLNKQRSFWNKHIYKCFTKPTIMKLHCKRKVLQWCSG